MSKENKILFICGVYPDDKIDISKNTKNFMQGAAERHQNEFITGFYENNIKPTIISAPFIGSYPKNYKKLFFKAPTQSNITFVSFFNLWGLRSISRYKHLLKEIKKLDLTSYSKVIIYSPHTPFVKLAKYVKKANKNIHVSLIVPDIPQYMNTNTKQSFVYKTLKKWDIKQFYKNIQSIDSFIFLTEQMNSVINKYNKPYMVVEGISKPCNTASQDVSSHSFVYTGLIHKKFGIDVLVEAFKLLPQQYTLHICGAGDYSNELTEICCQHKNIIYHGSVDSETAIKLQEEASVLVNPRQNIGEYTKYSFPSKIMEYLASGNPVVCYKLDGIPDEYDKYLIYPESNTVEALANALSVALNISHDERERMRKEVFSFLQTKQPKIAVKRILDFINNSEEQKYD